MPRRLLVGVAAASLLTGALVGGAVMEGSGPAFAGGCALGQQTWKINGEGARVALATNVMTTWQQVPSVVGYSVSKRKATSNASSTDTTADVKAEVGAGWGPFSAKVSAEYTKEWHVATTTSSSVTITQSGHRKVTQQGEARWHLFKEGVAVPIKATTDTYGQPHCQPIVHYFKVYLPLQSQSNDVYEWLIEIKGTQKNVHPW